MRDTIRGARVALLVAMAAAVAIAVPTSSAGSEPVATGEVRERITALRLTPLGSSSPDFRRFFADAVAKFAELTRLVSGRAEIRTARRGLFQPIVRKLKGAFA